MAYKEDAIELISESSNILEEIKILYNESLEEQKIKPRLSIKIKNFMENLRSALDFTAHHLYDNFGTNTGNPNQKTYFPYAWKSLDLDGFRTKNRVEQNIPGLITNRPDLVAKIESYQHFTDVNNSWLPKFMDLNNENKHSRLTPQTKTELKELRISSKNDGSSMSVFGDGNIFLANDAFIQIGQDTFIQGGQNFNVNNPPPTQGGGKKEIITWVDFKFTDIDESVLPLLESAMNGTRKIVSELTE